MALSRIQRMSRPGIVVPMAYDTLRNERTLVVGPRQATSNNIYHGLTSDFRTIGEAMRVIPLPPKKNYTDVDLRPGEDTWTILVTPGVYYEEIRMKPNVLLVGIGQSATIFPPNGAWVSPEGPGGRRAVVYMNHNTSVSNLNFAKSARMKSTDYVFWNRDMYNVGLRLEGRDIQVPDVAYPARTAERVLDASGIAIKDVWVWPYGDKGKTLLLEGDWHTALFTDFGSSYNERDGYDIEVRCKHKNADCHFMNCFFDALFMEEGPGGCMLIEDAFDVHVRGSLLRTNVTEAYYTAKNFDKATSAYRPIPGSCVCIRDTDETSSASDVSPTYVFLENTSLEAPSFPAASRSALQILGSRAKCSFRNSSADSFDGDISQLDRPALS
ncbi:MAG: hypothetical protein IPG50_13970 [Myxococcales bacterium]|nr:hypothetical protein [Myxococcales bacterium]